MTDMGDFVAMGGYGFYVWGSYLVTALLVVIEAVVVAARLKASRRADTNGRGR